MDELKAHGQCDHSNETPLAVLSHDSTICFSAFHTRYFCKFVFCQFDIRSVLGITPDLQHVPLHAGKKLRTPRELSK